MEEFDGLLRRWLQILADKGIEELILVNRPMPLGYLLRSTFFLPSTFLGMTTLTCLYLGLWKFPDMAGVKRSTFFPNLRELGLCTVLMESKDLDFILDRSPMLETLCVESNIFNLGLRLVSQSIRCVKIILSFFEEITVVDAPCLERLILSGGWTKDGVYNKVKISHAPKLQSLGYLDLENHVLEFGNTVIKAGTKASPSTMVPSVRILALDVRCGVRSYAKMIPAVLRCFPNVETLHIMSGETGQPSNKHNLEFLNESGTIKCIRSCIKLLVFHDFRGDRSELAFLKFFFKSALVPEEALIVMANGSFTLMEDMLSKVKPLGSMKWASSDSTITINPQGGSIWNFKKASDFSLCDPFAND
uniref:FBD domain-containing protein n=1 Tax=Triticum urartu TaxID=4572 RepID=A0A8R7K3H2_TRIUA